eukprot:149636-Hanusia_phi.AAC.5
MFICSTPQAFATKAEVRLQENPSDFHREVEAQRVCNRELLAWSDVSDRVQLNAILPSHLAVGAAGVIEER